MSRLERSFTTRWHLDWPLLMLIGILSILGFIVLYSAKQDVHVLFRQALRWGLAFGLMIVVAQIPPRFLKGFALPLYTFGMLLLTAVLIIGHISKGGQRWLDLWIIRFQPAEIMKLAVPLIVAKYFDHRILPPRLRDIFWPLLLIVIPFLLVAKQPDLGTAIVILCSGMLVIFFTGLNWKWIISFCVITISACPLLWMFLRDYQRQRVIMFLDPEQDPLGAGYHIIQSKIAIGSGGLYGKGWLNGSQSHLEYLPERTTDSIFAVFGEEFGFIGALILLTLYVLLILRGLIIGVQAQETFTRLLSGSLILTVAMYIVVNIGMVVGILPVVGLPLPLISYGGTSLLTLMVSFGILMSIQTHRSLLGK